ncbi:helix-turn-helix domain-containing protein [Aerococcus viridans]
MNELTVNLGKRIKELRKKNNISQEKLAFLAELDRTYVNSVENGKRNISIINIGKIANSLNTDLPNFFDSDYFRNEDI